MKIGDYIRTKSGFICRIVNINEFREPCMKYGIEASYLDDIRFIGDDDIKLVKEKPIDLIEVGDYVNGCKIIELATNIDGKVLYLETDITEFDNLYACGHINIYEKDIKSIVTHEQFESMEYKVVE